MLDETGGSSPTGDFGAKPFLRAPNEASAFCLCDAVRGGGLGWFDSALASAVVVLVGLAKFAEADALGLVDGLMFAHALDLLLWSSCDGLGVVGGTPNPEYLLAPFEGVRAGMLGRFGGGGY